MKKRLVLAVLALLMVSVMIAPAAASASTITKTWSNSNTQVSTVLTYTPSSTSDYISSLACRETSSVSCYRKIACKVVSWTTLKYSGSTSVVKCYNQSYTFSPRVYVNHGWNSTQGLYYAGTYSYLLVNYYTAAYNDL